MINGKVVSVVIPIYNVALYIERCLQSVLDQTYTRIDCLLVDDCTEDDSISRCQRMTINYKGPVKIQYLKHNSNRGLSASRNTGTLAAKGDFIFYLDGDDYIAPDCIETLVSEAEKYPEVEMICGRAEPESMVFATNEYVHLTDNKAIRFRLLCQQQAFPVPAWNKLIKRDFLLRNKLLFEEGLIHEDVLWTFGVVQKLNSVSLLPHTTYCYFQREQSIINGTKHSLRANSMMIVLRKIAENAEEPFRRLAIYKYLLRVFDWFRYSTTSNRKTYYSFFKALFQEHRYGIAIICICFFSLCPKKYGRRMEKKIRECIAQLYNREEKLIIDKYHGFNSIY